MEQDEEGMIKNDLKAGKWLYSSQTRVEESSGNLPMLAVAILCSMQDNIKSTRQTIKKFISGSFSVCTQLLDTFSSAARFQIT